MSPLEPSEEDISSVAEFTALDPVSDRAMIICALKNNNRNPNDVIGRFYENQQSFINMYGGAWDDSMFTADRDGTDNHNNNNTNGTSFHVEAPYQNDVIHGVTPPPDHYGAGAPSRPPSRSNNRSPLDWNTAAASGQPNNQAQEDEDMQRALRESAQEAGISVPPHETGVVDKSTAAPNFGPANRNDYDQGSWAMVPVNHSESKLSHAPAPLLRKRVNGAPAFLVQGYNSAGDNRLGGLLTILHEIPLARNILLDTGSPAASYGHNSEWWKGQEILPPHVLARIQSGELQWGQQEEARSDFDEELHRLMAFLDSTERSYGTTSVITDLVPFTNLGAEKQFYELLRERNGEKVRPLMQVASLAHVKDSSSGFEDATFCILEMEHLRSEYAFIKTLYESMDHVMWSDVLSWRELHSQSKMALFKEMGDVIVFKIGGDGPEDSIDIPQELYPEKYLTSRKEEARRIQLGWCETKLEIAKIEKDEENIRKLQDQGKNQVLQRKEILERAHNQWNGYQEYLDGLARFQAMENTGFDTTRYPEYRAAPNEMQGDEQALSQKIKDAVHYVEEHMASVETKLKSLHNQLEYLRAKQRFLGRLLTVPDKPGRPRPMTCKKYLLRGVATSKDVVYVCQRAEADLIDFGDTPKPSDQWWRLAYVPNDEQPVKTEKVEIERVFRDMWQETKRPLLVYATDVALDTPRAVLSDPLERFVKAENKAFRKELSNNNMEASERRISTPLDPISPSKRKHRSESIDSMDSNRASLGSDDRNEFDNPFSDAAGNNGTEMTGMFANAAEIARSEEVGPPAGMVGQPLGLAGDKPVSTGNTSATMTPSTMAAEEADFDKSQQTEGIDTGSTTPGIAEAKSPEMQERARPPSFMAMSNSTSDKKSPINMMDMEIPEHQD